MKRWIVRLEAIIDDTMEIEAETAEEAEEFANEDWMFTEAHSWKTTAEEEVES
jgi:hypothetical protein